MEKERTQKTEEKYGLSRYFLLTMLLSLFGWAFETVYMRIATGEWVHRGFMTLPFCPIYGCSLVFVYFLVGTPQEGRFLLRRVRNTPIRYLLYFAIAFIVPSAMELIVGWFFNKTMHLRLWSYAHAPLNIEGYVCLRNSIVWAVLIFLFMRFVFPWGKCLIGFIPKFFARVLAFALLLVVIADTSFNVANVLYRK